MNIIEIIKIEENDSIEKAIKILKSHIITEGPCEEKWHQLGRLFHKLSFLIKAKRAYLMALEINNQRPNTINNLGLIELESLNPNMAENYLKNGLNLLNLSKEDRSLLLNSSCQLKIFQQKFSDALLLAKEQLQINESARSYSNLAISLQWCGRSEEAVEMQVKALVKQLKLSKVNTIDLDFLLDLCWKPRQNIQESVDTHIQLMNLGVLRLYCNQNDEKSQKLLLAGMGTQIRFWQEAKLRENIWQGQWTENLILWDDQGFGDTIQNLGWISEASIHTEKLTLWIRPSLIDLIQARLDLPSNCCIEVMHPNSKPWEQGYPHLGLWYLPITIGAWKHGLITKSFGSKPEQSIIKRPSIGLVWSAGSHLRAQPEGNARVRDVPFSMLINQAKRWGESKNASLQSLQQGALSNEPSHAVKKGLLIPAPQSSNWQNTANLIESLIAVVTVDTAIAHLCGMLKVPCVLLLNKPCDWRWGNAGSKSALYPSLRLARCHEFGAWESALNKATSLLHEMLE